MGGSLSIVGHGPTVHVACTELEKQLQLLVDAKSTVEWTASGNNGYTAFATVQGKPYTVHLKGEVTGQDGLITFTAIVNKVKRRRH